MKNDGPVHKENPGRGERKKKEEERKKERNESNSADCLGKCLLHLLFLSCFYWILDPSSHLHILPFDFLFSRALFCFLVLLLFIVSREMYFFLIIVEALGYIMLLLRTKCHRGEKLSQIKNNSIKCRLLVRCFS